MLSGDILMCRDRLGGGSGDLPSEKNERKDVLARGSFIPDLKGVKGGPGEVEAQADRFSSEACQRF